MWFVDIGATRAIVPAQDRELEIGIRYHSFAPPRRFFRVGRMGVRIRLALGVNPGFRLRQHGLSFVGALIARVTERVWYHDALPV